MAHEGGMSNLLTLGLVAVGGYFLYEWLFATPTTTTTTGTTPGTTSTMNQGGGQTSVSTAPSSTATGLQTLAANMQSVNNGMTSGTADQWDYAFAQIIGQPIDQKYGFAFDAVYGPITSPGVRNNGATMTAAMFLQLAASAKGGSLPGLSGLGQAFVRYPGVPVNTFGSMVYQAHHPMPHGITNDLRRFRGLGGPVVATGMEKAVFAGRPLGRNKLVF